MANNIPEFYHSATTKLRPRRGAYTEWVAEDPILLEGEIGIEYPDSGIMTGDMKIKMGDGIHKWTELPYAIDPKEAISIYGGDVYNYHMLRLRSGTTEQWEEADPLLEYGELVFDETKGELKCGDGIHKFSELRYIGQIWDKDVTYDFGDFDNPNTL